MISRCLFITSSYSRVLFRAWKFRDSTLIWAFSMDLVSILFSMGMSSSMSSRSIRLVIRSPPNRRIRSSSRLR